MAALSTAIGACLLVRRHGRKPREQQLTQQAGDTEQLDECVPTHIEETQTAIALGPDTAKYLDDKAAESFKRQADLEESIWRSIPLFTGALIAGAALIATAAPTLPLISPQLFPIVSYGALAIAAMLFAASFWWLWQVVKPREYDYPADDAAIAAYSHEMTAFRANEGFSGDALDKQVLQDLRAYMTEILGKAAKSTFVNNQERLSARSQVLVLLLWAFVITFAAEATIYGRHLLTGSLEGSKHKDATGNASKSASAAGRKAGTSHAAANAGNKGRGVANKIEHSGTGERKAEGKLNERGNTSSNHTSHVVNARSAGSTGSATNAATYKSVQ